MGKNPYLWPFPIFLNSGKIYFKLFKKIQNLIKNIYLFLLGKPVGDGVLWP